tara:strand:+ start:5627 stop:6628 length:1002 start_codon:yes stop_codon:yes gene_type:complete
MPQTALEETELTESVVGDAPKAETAPVENEEFEVIVEDDTPQADRERDPMPEAIVDSLENDELEEYSAEKTKQLKKVWHDERRAKEAAEREREAAVTFARKIMDENNALKQDLGKGEGMLIDTAKTSAGHELEVAKRNFREAYDAGDVDAVTNAQEQLVSAKMKLQSAENYVAQYNPEALQAARNDINNTVEGDWSAQQVPQQEAPLPDEKAVAWQKRNPWWGQKRDMTSLAFGLHEDLIMNGVDPASDEYYESIDKNMRKRFPEEFAGETSEETSSPKRARSQTTVVSPVKRTTGSRKAVITASEKRLADRLQLTPEAYVAEKLKLEALQNG